MSDENTVEAEVKRATQEAIQALNQAAIAPYQLPSAIADDPPPAAPLQPKAAPPLERSSNTMEFKSAQPQAPQMPGSARSSSSSSGSTLPPPPTPGTYVLGAVDGVIQWLATEQCDSPY